MTALPLDVWIMMIFSILVFFGVSLWALIHSLRQEEQKMDILRSEGTLDPYSPQALDDLQAWIEAHPNDPDIKLARERYEECVQALKSMNRSFYEWSKSDIQPLERS